MSTINLSLPDPLREYVEVRAAQGNFSFSEYLRQLIRDDKKRVEIEERDMLWELLAIGVKQLDDGETVDIDAAGVVAQGRARRAAAAGPA